MNKSYIGGAKLRMLSEFYMYAEEKMALYWHRVSHIESGGMQHGLRQCCKDESIDWRLEQTSASGTGRKRNCNGCNLTLK